ncbi:MAG: Asparagine synthetase [Candidatus Moranbacteria bacterium GW2011_GWF2_36_839]|nr:MAG: Asparagine synthetase [Candidatus Moranbacteria bacterium GW2011_GWF1_36_78]KKQ17686.1 MAG: Asparagine synthetase [Candidatus Moranbacteria bacterium GW2011_GWF2_36_839]HAT73389.1 asparagine synthase (glutamine-hydrolyzing) [Candidatus Moranbacteria bacterium]HBY10752.1 asparagine synthase (glutamine-hydrolyzing) [Candidatus Moranbacteria bacterium]
MCGITGKIYFENDSVSEQDILAMNEKILHRGPDDGGVYISQDKKIGLGHRRLSIIDLSPLGHQPMNYLNRYWIVFNGEIYNFQEKREMLIKEGYTFKSKADTEVLLALYDKFGKKCLEHLRGMFSFAIYDEKEKTIFCARDRVGKKPFKYYLNENVFIFASELKAILTQKEYRKEPDYVAIHHYLTLQYCPTPLTGFKDLKKLEPAHYLLINLKTKKVEKERYWKLDYSKKLDMSEDEWKKRIMKKLEESVRLRMISDVPLGTFLSGGIDSSAIVALMSKLSNKPVKTFSIGFEEEKYNELKYARIVAEKFKTDHKEFVVKPNAIELLPMLVKQYEEPFADSSALPTYYVSKMTRDFVTVALNGDGGDENFAGYGRYSVQKFGILYNKLIPFHKQIILPIAKFLAKNIKNTFFDRAYVFSNTLSQKYDYRYVNYIRYFSNELKNEIYTDSFKEKTKNIDSYNIVAEKFGEAETKNKMDQCLFADFSTYLPDDLMVKVDIDSMAVALEGRSPFLDHELLELTAQIPFNLKIKGLNNKKYILKEALRGLVPDEVMFRPKMGFGIPIDVWFRAELKNFAYDTLLSEKAINRKLFKKEAVRALLDEHVNTQISHAYRIWALITLELWFREYFDK